MLENGALGKKFDAYPQRQSVTESININSLTDHHIWSTIKTLPATLPEPSFEDRGSSFKRRGYWSRFAVRFGCLLGGGSGYTGLGSCAFDLGCGIYGGHSCDT